MRRIEFRYPIAARIFLGFGLILAAQGGVAVFSAEKADLVRVEAEKVEGHTAATSLLPRLSSAYGEAIALTVRYALTEDDEDRNRVMTALVAVDEQVAILARVSTPTEIRELRELVAVHREAVEKNLEAVNQRRNAVAVVARTIADELRPRVNSLTTELGQLGQGGSSDTSAVAVTVGIVETFEGASQAIWRFVASRRPFDAAAARQEVAKLGTLAGSDEAKAITNRRLRRQISPLPEAAEKVSREISALVDADAKAAAAAAARDEAAADLSDALASFSRRKIGAQKDSVAAMSEVVAQNAQMGLTIAGIALLIGAIWALLTGRSIAQPITRLTRSMQAISSGATEVEVTDTSRRDEVGDMAKGLLVFQAKISEVRQLEKERVEFERETMQSAREERAELAQQVEMSIGSIVTTIRETSMRLEEAAVALSGTASVVANQAGEAARSTDGVSAEVGAAAMSAREVSAGLQLAASQGEGAMRVAREAVASAESTSAHVQQLNAAATKVGDIVKVIGDIASRTNLLALNATIEAARAGAAGKGFAVVAQEVKSLAKQTATATDEVTKMITGIQDATGQTVASIGEIGSAIQRVDRSTGEVVGSIADQNRATMAISHVISDAAELSKSASQAVGQLSHAAAQTSKAAEDLKAMAAEFHRQGEYLREQIDAIVEGLRCG